MDRKSRSFTLILFVFSALAISNLSSLTYAQTVTRTSIKETKTEKLLKEIKAAYSPFQGENSFIISYSGKVNKEIDVVVLEVGLAVAIFADAAAGRDVDLTPEKMRNLLKFNSRSDYIKVGISDLGSVRVHSEQNLLLINAKFFEEVLDQVAAGTDEVARIIGPINKKPAKR